MKVKATKQGYLGRIIEAGEIFELKDIEYKNADGAKQVHKAKDQFSDTWMAPLTPNEVKKVAKQEEENGSEDDQPGSGSVI